MTLITGHVRLRRSDAILDAVRLAVEKRRSLLNNETSVRSVSFTVKFKNGTDSPRTVVTVVELDDELGE